MDQGGLRLTFAWDGQRVIAADVASTRPQAARVLIGLPVQRAVDLVPRLFSLCGQAQGVAARLAWAAARGEVPDGAALREDSRRVALEAIGEHLWRLLLDWPPMSGLPARKDEFLMWRKRLLSISDEAGARALGDALSRWLDAAPPPQWAGVPATCAPGALLPLLNADAWAQQLSRDEMHQNFAGQPVFAGAPAETGALARQAQYAGVARLLADGQHLAARLAARYADLRFLASALLDPERLTGWLDAAPLASGGGLARVETARGLLLHLIHVKDGRVGRYVIVAPTEWNFHPQGAFVREITGCQAATAAAAELAARRLALALDPCVAYDVVINSQQSP